MSSAPNQPPLSYFDESFSKNPSDVLFCSLNEIDPLFTDKEFLKVEDFIQEQILDPRNKLPVVQCVHNHTINQKPELFKSNKRSFMTPKEHGICMSFLQSIQAKKQVFPHQLECYEKTFKKRQKEQNEFLQFLTQYNNANYENIYSPGLMFVEFYQQFYRRETQRLMEKHHDAIFQIHTGLPIPQKCGNSEMLGTITDIEVMSQTGNKNWVHSEVDLSKMKPKLQTYFDLYLSGQTENITHLDRDCLIEYQISVEALVFLLCAGEYMDKPTEVLVEVETGENGESIINIDEPLPSRNTGVHTAELVTRMCADVFLGMQSDKCLEINATGFNLEYNLQTIDNFQSSEKHSKPFSKPINKSSSLVKWNLNFDSEKKQIAILTRANAGQWDSQRGKLVFFSLKLEYKPQFGCEIISKANLLKEWIELRLSGSTDAVIDRYRISASNFKTLVRQDIVIEDIENELERRYKIKMPRLLGSLGDFVSLLCNVNSGRYLLRFNSRFQDKLVLYAETKESTSKSNVSLYGLLQESPSDLAFMTMRQLTPIDDTLCSAMHEFYKILPCSFPPGKKATTKIIDDRNFILKKVQMKQELELAKAKKLKLRRSKVKRLKRTQRLKQKKQEKHEEHKETTELEDEIEKDRILFGFE